MTNWGRIIEEQIRRAMESGAFEDLPGAGQPLEWQENPHADPSWRLAWQLLKSNDYSLPWLEERHAIETELAAARGRLRQQAVRQKESEEREPSEYAQAAWERAVKAFRDQAEALNRKIFDYNLGVPSDRFQRLPVDPESEIRKAAAHLGHE